MWCVNADVRCYLCSNRVDASVLRDDDSVAATAICASNSSHYAAQYIYAIVCIMRQRCLGAQRLYSVVVHR
jgi:hypothetical protein